MAREPLNESGGRAGAFALAGAPAVFPGLTVERLRRCAGRLAHAPSRIETRSARFVQRFPREIPVYWQGRVAGIYLTGAC